MKNGSTFHLAVFFQNHVPVGGKCFFYKKNILQASWVFLAILLEEPQILPRWLDEPEDFFPKEDHIKHAGTGKIYVPGSHTLVVRKQQVIPSALRHEPVFKPGCQL